MLFPSIVGEVQFDHVVWGVVIPLAIVVALFKAVMRHRERMAKIGMGIDPNRSPVDPAEPRAVTSVVSRLFHSCRV
jgi:hypothetical protein